MSNKVIKFKERIITDSNKIINNSEIINSKDLDILLNNFKSIDVIYPGVGSNLDLINEYSNQKQISLNYIFREEDLTYWKFAKSGFNKFKTSFNAINNI